jgi:hypothetical protein
MARYIVLHPLDLLNSDLKDYTSEAQMGLVKKYLDVFTKDTYAVSSWSAIGAGLLFCMWEGPSEQAIIDVIAKVSDGPATEGIYPVSVIDWAEMKKAMAG